MGIPTYEESRFHLAEMICRRFPPGAERQAWLDWLASCREGQRPPPTPPPVGQPEAAEQTHDNPPRPM